MSDTAQLSWTLVLLAFVGMLWSIFAPNCLGRSFVYPSVFGASVVGYISGRQSVSGDPEVENHLKLLVFNWLYGWAGLIFAVPAVGLGWFLGVLICFNVLPEFGDYRCVNCLEAE